MTNEKTPQTAHSVDIKVGQTIRSLRRLRGMKQQELADRINISFQQLQKYETAANRISASRMYEIAAVLQVKPGLLFEGQGSNIPDLPIFASRKMAHLVQTFARITDPEKHKAILKLVDVIADESDGNFSSATNQEGKSQNV